MQRNVFAIPIEIEFAEVKRSGLLRFFQAFGDFVWSKFETYGVQVVSSQQEFDVTLRNGKAKRKERCNYSLFR